MVRRDRRKREREEEKERERPVAFQPSKVVKREISPTGAIRKTAVRTQKRQGLSEEFLERFADLPPERFRQEIERRRAQGVDVSLAEPRLKEIEKEEKELAKGFEEGKVFEEQPEQLEFVTEGPGGVTGTQAALLEEAQRAGLTPEQGLKYADARVLTKGQRETFKRLNPQEAENFERALLKVEFEQSQRSLAKKARDEIGRLAEVAGIPTRIAGLDIPLLKLVRQPSEKVEDYVSEVSKMSEIVSAMGSDGSRLSPIQTLNRLNEMDEDLNELIANIQIQIINSEELRANPEPIGDIQKEILDVQNEIFFARREVANSLRIGFEEPTGQEYYSAIERYRKLAKGL